MANEKRLIYLEDAKDALIGWETDPTDDEIEYTLDSLPKVDAVEVVRCKDCKDYLEDGYCFRLGVYMNEDDFCSYGEKMEDDGNEKPR